MTNTLKFALYGLHRGSSVDPDILVQRAQRAEEVGFEALWVGDHIALPDNPDNPAFQPRLEAVVTLAHLAAVTRRVRLGFGVIVLPQRQPLLLAKQISSIDVLSGGRVTLGVGVGHLEPELRAMGVSPAERGARTDEYLEALRLVWDEPTPALDGRFVSFANVVQRPRPVQQPHPPIVIGGDTPAALRRAVLAGNGWYGWELDVDEAARAIAALHEAADRHGRPAALGPLEITITPPDTLDLATAQAYAAVGVHRLTIQPDTMDGSAIDDLITQTAETLIDQVPLPT